MTASIQSDDLALFLTKHGVDLSPTNKILVDPTDFYEEVAVGSHIARPCQESHLGPWHHGIFVGNKRVIHMSGDTVEDALIQQCSVRDFFQGHNATAVVLYAGDDDAHREATVLAATKLAADAAGPRILINHMFDILDFNCEHFAVLCRTGLDGDRYDSSLETIACMLRGASPEVPFAGKFWMQSSPHSSWQSTVAN